MDKINKWSFISGTAIFNLIPIIMGPRQIDSALPLVALILFTIIFGIYALQFTLTPSFMLTTHFEKSFDEYHLFISRVFGLTTFFYILSSWFVQYHISFHICATYLLLITICGPLYAEICLQPKKIHHVAHICTFILTTLYVSISMF